MMQHAVDLWAFARPPPPGFFGLGSCCARLAVDADVPASPRTPPLAVFGLGPSFARYAIDADVPARPRPPPPGFSRRRRALPPPPCEIPVPQKPPKRAAPPAPVSTDAAEKPSATKRQRLCSDYEDDIDANLRLTERSPEERPRPDYLKAVQQGRVTPSARASLVGWMDAFVRRYGLADGTLHHAVAYVDRFLSARAMNTDRELRLLGAVAVFVAAKYEDRCTVLKLDADKIARYGGFATRKEVLDMERRMVEALGYQLGGPTAHTFVGHFTRHAQGEDELKIQRMAHRLADRSLLDYTCLGYLPSVVAAAAIFLARCALNPPDVLTWSTEMQQLTGYSVLDLGGSCLPAMCYFSQSIICEPRC
uniref:Uncharacterized protein n=1 Tax=Avena sativa TaxID=4498 RepID=A0ACD5ZGC1_AVESA